jgi:hypothetical protein
MKQFNVGDYYRFNWAERDFHNTVIKITHIDGMWYDFVCVSGKQPDCNGKPSARFTNHSECANRLVPADIRTIVITHKYGITLARLMDGKKVIKSAEAKCAPDDTFDFATGAGLAFDRLMGREKPQDKPEPEQPKYWSGKVVCVDDESTYFTAGKVYAFKNGVVSDDDGDVYNHIYPAKTVAEALKRKKVKFIEYKGEAK